MGRSNKDLNPTTTEKTSPWVPAVLVASVVSSLVSSPSLVSPSSSFVVSVSTTTTTTLLMLLLLKTPMKNNKTLTMLPTPLLELLSNLLLKSLNPLVSSPPPTLSILSWDPTRSNKQKQEKKLMSP